MILIIIKLVKNPKDVFLLFPLKQFMHPPLGVTCGRWDEALFLVFDIIIIWTGFVLFWAFEIPWLSMTFSMTSPSFPWPKIDHFLGNHLLFWVRFYYFLRKKPQFILYFLINVILHDFPWPTPTFHDFPGLENEILKFHYFPGFPWPVWTLLEEFTTIGDCVSCFFFFFFFRKSQEKAPNLHSFSLPCGFCVLQVNPSML